jgi:hypothetical protein
LLLLEAIDFAGSSLPALCRQANGKLVVVLTKMDLLPSIAKRPEIVNWVRAQLAQNGIRPLALFPVSSKTGQGIPELMTFMKRKKSIAIVGAANVGKSALLARLLPCDAPKPTVSNLKGTTQGLNLRSWEGGQIFDTPGLSPAGRIDEYLCPSCQVKLVPSRPVQSKLYELDKGQALLFGTLGGVINEGSPVVLQVYMPGSIKLHRTSDAKARLLLTEKPAWLGGDCSCSAWEWETKAYLVKPLEDLAISGLGWLSVRRASANLAVLLPQGVRTQVRTALLQKR